MWIVDELKAKGFVKGAVVKYVRGGRHYKITSINSQGLVTIRIINHDGKLGNSYEKQAFLFLRGYFEVRTSAPSQPLPYANRS